MKKYNNIQALRAFAAIGVMLFHGAGVYGEIVQDQSWVMDLIAHHGYVGVDLFFVISGFVAAHTTIPRQRGVASAVRYLYCRVSRIYLGYWPFFCFSLLVSYAYYPSLFAQFNLIKSFFLAILIGIDKGSDIVLYVSWSLTYELLFYVIVALSLFVRPNLIVKVLLAFTLTVGILLINSMSHPLSLAASTFFGFLLEFLFGALVRIYIERIRGLDFCIMATLLAIAGFYVGLHGEPPQAAERSLSIGLGCVGVVVLALLAERHAAGVAPRWMVALGDSSFTLYLVHVIFWTLLGNWGISDWISHYQPIVRTVGFWSLVGFCVIFSHIYSSYIEIPLYRMASSLRIPFKFL